MKKEIRTLILTCMILGAILSGCTGTAENTEQLFYSDTVVNIPLNPETTEAEATEEATLPEETAAETLAPTEPTEETKATATTKTTTTKSSSSSKTSSSKTSSTSKTTTKATEPPATEAPATQPTETQPPVTENVETAPPETETEAPATEVPPTEVPATEIPAAEIPETEPPATQSPEEAVYDISDYAVGGLEYGVVEQINACRAAEGLEPLSMSGTLCGIASVRAYEVCQSWSHTRPNGSGWQSVLSDYGYGYGAAAEDLVHSAGFDAASIVAKWMGSDGSKADILSADFTAIGVGVYNVDGTTFIAAIFVG